MDKRIKEFADRIGECAGIRVHFFGATSHGAVIGPQRDIKLPTKMLIHPDLSFKIVNYLVNEFEARLNDYAEKLSDEPDDDFIKIYDQSFFRHGEVNRKEFERFFKGNKKRETDEDQNRTDRG